jgi:DNA-binding CsgD family transcriptional regulator
VRTVDTASPQVTKPEREVLELAAHGQSSKRIAYQLGISESAANYHIASIKRKFRARTRSHAIAQAVQSGLIR